MDTVKIDQLWDVATGTGDWKRARVINVVNGVASLYFVMQPYEPSVKTVEAVAVDDMLRQPDRYRFYANGETPP